jgi:hypothetical protein
MRATILFTIAIAPLSASADVRRVALVDRPADAYASRAETLDQRWPCVPAAGGLSVEDVMTDHLTELGNAIGGHLDRLSHDLIGLSVDGRGHRARVRVGGGDPHYLTLRVDSDWLFADGKAEVHAKVELAVAGHEVQLALPALQVAPDPVYGAQAMQVSLPLLAHRF